MKVTRGETPDCWRDIVYKKGACEKFPNKTRKYIKNFDKFGGFTNNQIKNYHFHASHCNWRFRSCTGSVTSRSCIFVFFIMKVYLVFQKTPVLMSPFNQFADFQACNFIKKRLQHSAFLSIFLNFYGNIFCRTSVKGCFCDYRHLM